MKFVFLLLFAVAALAAVVRSASLNHGIPKTSEYIQMDVEFLNLCEKSLDVIVDYINELISLAEIVSLSTNQMTPDVESQYHSFPVCHPPREYTSDILMRDSSPVGHTREMPYLPPPPAILQEEVWIRE